MTYNVRDFAKPDLEKHGWEVMTPMELASLFDLVMMATLSLRMRDDLKAKAQQLASQQGVSLNSYINATLAATITQAETLAIMGDRLSETSIERNYTHASWI